MQLTVRYISVLKFGALLSSVIDGILLVSRDTYRLAEDCGESHTHTPSESIQGVGAALSSLLAHTVNSLHSGDFRHQTETAGRRLLTTLAAAVVDSLPAPTALSWRQ